MRGDFILDPGNHFFIVSHSRQLATAIFVSAFDLACASWHHDNVVVEDQVVANQASTLLPVLSRVVYHYVLTPLAGLSLLIWNNGKVVLSICNIQRRFIVILLHDAQYETLSRTDSLLNMKLLFYL